MNDRPRQQHTSADEAASTRMRKAMKTNTRTHTHDVTTNCNANFNLAKKAVVVVEFSVRFAWGAQPPRGSQARPDGAFIDTKSKTFLSVLAQSYGFGVRMEVEVRT